MPFPFYKYINGCGGVVWSKVSKAIMVATVIFSFIMVVPFTNASAIGADTVVKAAGGKLVIRSLAEKAGMTLSNKQLDNVVGVIEKKSFDGDTKAIDFLNKSNAIVNNPSSMPASKTGFKKYVLEPALWLSGLDLIFDAVDAFSDGYNNGSDVDVYSYPSFSIEFEHWSGNEYRIIGRMKKGDINKVAQGSPVISYIDSDSSTVDLPPDPTLGSYEITSDANGFVVMKDVNVTYKKYDFETTTRTGVTQITFPDVLKTSVEDGTTTISPSSTDVVNTDNSNDIKTNFDNDTYDNDTTYNVEVELPDDKKVDENEEPWNEKDTNISVEVDVDVDVEVDTDNDGTPDSSDTDDDGDGIPDDEDDGSPSTGKPVDWLVVVDDEIPIHEKFFLEMADVGQKIEDMYNGVVHFFDVSIDGFTTLTTGMTGFVSFLDSFFDWLPSEYRALLGSGFTLGVVAFFLRR